MMMLPILWLKSKLYKKWEKNDQCNNGLLEKNIIKIHKYFKHYKLSKSSNVEWARENDKKTLDGYKPFEIIPLGIGINCYGLSIEIADSCKDIQKKILSLPNKIKELLDEIVDIQFIYLEKEIDSRIDGIIEYLKINKKLDFESFKKEFNNLIRQGLDYILNAKFTIVAKTHTGEDFMRMLGMAIKIENGGIELVPVEKKFYDITRSDIAKNFNKRIERYNKMISPYMSELEELEEEHSKK